MIGLFPVRGVAAFGNYQGSGAGDPGGEHAQHGRRHIEVGVARDEERGRRDGGERIHGDAVDVVGAGEGDRGIALVVLQAQILPGLLGFGHPAIWGLALVAGLVVGALIGALHGLIIAFLGVPSFIVTLGGLLVWRGATWFVTSGQTVAPMDATFRLMGGGTDKIEADAASFMYSTILSHRASWLSAPTLNPIN